MHAGVVHDRARRVLVNSVVLESNCGLLKHRKSLKSSNRPKQVTDEPLQRYRSFFRRLGAGQDVATV